MLRFRANGGITTHTTIGTTLLTLTPGCLVMLSSSTDCRNLDSEEEGKEKEKEKDEDEEEKKTKEEKEKKEEE